MKTSDNPVNVICTQSKWSISDPPHMRQSVNVQCSAQPTSATKIQAKSNTDWVHITTKSTWGQHKTPDQLSKIFVRKKTSRRWLTYLHLCTSNFVGPRGAPSECSPSYILWGLMSKVVRVVKGVVVESRRAWLGDNFRWPAYDEPINVHDLR